MTGDAQFFPLICTRDIQLHLNSMNGTKLKLNCPLCCKEVFDSHEVLKDHLLNMADNLICPSCSNHFEKIVDLVKHLDDCRDNKTQIADIPEESVLSQPVSESDDKEMNSILAQALLKTSEMQIEAEIKESNVTKNEEKNSDNTLESSDVVHIVEENNEEEEIYYCSCCDISFTSIAEHLQNYHEGQEVYIQVSVEKSIISIFNV